MGYSVLDTESRYFDWIPACAGMSYFSVRYVYDF